MILYTHRFSTPLTELTAAVNDAGALVWLAFSKDRDDLALAEVKPGDILQPDAQRTAVVVEQLDAYFRGERRMFDLPLAARGTPFQQSVWAALQAIPYGTTITYRDLAIRIGNPAAVRAVGRANGANPLPIIVPCHRVIGSDGKLIGYGGGMALKEHLLRLEGARLM